MYEELNIARRRLRKLEVRLKSCVGCVTDGNDSAQFSANKQRKLVQTPVFVS